MIQLAKKKKKDKHKYVQITLKTILAKVIQNITQEMRKNVSNYLTNKN